MSRRKLAGKPLTATDEAAVEAKPAQTATREQVLIEQLSAKEHASWARWQAYLHSRCEQESDGSLVIPAAYVEALQDEIDTPYAELPEHLKQYDRDEVAHILPIIQEYATTPETIPVRLEVVFALDGQPLGAVGDEVRVPIPAAGSDDKGHIVMQLDAREIVQRLTHALAEREAQKRGGILLPGANRPLPASLFTGPRKLD